ncbi:MAG TPA: GvpL/GvpF family gas vesicle protein [Actinomycetota bacterium]|nr:GvpL/GvpF family gas vesicle protein [Actinomycetota bacterium]
MTTALYLYGIVSTSDMPRAVRCRGVAGADTTLLAEGEVAAVTAAVPADFVAGRADLMAHSDVLQEIVGAHDVLPVGFGTLFTSVEELSAGFLRPNHDELVRMLRRTHGLVEVQVKGEYDEEAVARAVAASDPAIARLQRRARDRGDVDGMIDLGHRFAQALDRQRYSDARAIVDALSPHAQDVAVGDAAGEYGLVDAAFLVARTDLPEFDTAAARAAEALSDRAALRAVGSLPPYSFVDAGALVTS